MYRPYVERHWLTSSIPSGAWGAGGGRATCSVVRALRRSPRWGTLLRPVRAADRLETFMCEERKNVDFGFKSARAPLRYAGAGKRIVHALK